MPNDVIVIVKVNADQAIATMEQVTQKTEKLADKTEEVADKTEEAADKTALSASEWRRAGTALGHFGQAMTNVLVLTNLLPGSMGKAVNTTLLLFTTTINAVYAIGQLKTAYDALAKTQRIQIALQSILHALSGVGIAKLAIGVAAGAALGAGAIALANRAGDQGGGGNTYNFNGPMMGNDAEARSFARQIDQNLRDDKRLGR